MATINFSVEAPPGAAIGNVDGMEGYISSYIAGHISGYSVQNNTIFCIAPDLEASGPVSSYTVLSGISGPGFSTTQINALEGIFSHYIDGGNKSFATQEVTMIADWTIVNPNLVVHGVPFNILHSADILVNEALSNQLTIDPNLQFTTFESNIGGQNFVNISQVPLPGSFGLLLSAIVLLAAYTARKKLFKA